MSSATAATSATASASAATSATTSTTTSAATSLSLFESVFSNSIKTECSQLLSNLAASDGHHDQPLSVNSTTIEYLGKGLPNNPVVDSVEGEVEIKAFKSILIDQLPQISFTDYIKGKIGSTINIGIGSSNKPLHTYEIGHMQIEASSNGPGRVTPDADPSVKFAEILGLRIPTTKIVFSVDFNHHSFVENLIKGTTKQPNPIYIITGPPNVNDPGPKVNPFDKTIFKQEHTQGYQICSVVETAVDNLGTDYTPYNVDLASPNNMFISKYNINLSSLKQVITGKSSKFTTDMVISYSPSGDLKPYIATITNSGDNNSNSIIKAKLISILAKLRSLTGSNEATKNIEYFNFNEKLAEKRSGDFLQAEFLLDLTKRSFMQIIPTRQPLDFKDNTIGFFVTHDLVAGSYALFLGINLIFLDYYGNVFVFKNIKDFERVGDKINIPKMLFDNFKTHGLFVEGVIDNAAVYSYAYNGTTDLPSITEIYKREIAGSFETILNDIAVLMREDKQLKFFQYFQRTLVINLRTLFSQLVKFTYFTLIFPKLDLELLTRMKTFFNEHIKSSPEYVKSLELDDQIETFNKYYSNLLGIHHKLEIPVDVVKDLNLLEQIQRMVISWVDNNVKRLDIFIAAKTLFISDQTDTDIDEKYVRELDISVVRGKSREVDRHIFLPYIQKLNFGGKEMLDSQLSGLNNSMTDLMNKYKSFIFDQEKSLLDTVKTFFRGGKLPPTQRLYYKVCSFLIDSQIFSSTIISSTNILDIKLDDDKEKEIIAKISILSGITPVIQESNLVTEDLSDIQKFASPGGKDVDSFYDGDKAIQVKSINLDSDIYIEKIEPEVDATYTSNVEMAGGAGLYSFYLRREKNSKGTGIKTVGNGFDDSSDNFHITRPYLTYILTETTTEPQLNADIVKICEEEAENLGINLTQDMPPKLYGTGEYNINYLNALLTKLEQTRRVKPNFISTKVGGGAGVGVASSFYECKLSDLQREKDLTKIKFCLDNLLKKLNSLIGSNNTKLIDEIQDDILDDTSVILEYPMEIRQLLNILKEYKEKELNELKKINQPGINTEKIENDLLLITLKISECDQIFEKSLNFAENMGVITDKKGGLNRFLQHGGANENLLNTFIYGFHPLLTLYIQFSAFWYSISPKMQNNNAFYDEFISYYTILTKMITVLRNKYLNDPNDDIKVLQAYFIGFGLKTLLQSSFNDDKELKAVLEVVGINTNDPTEIRKYSAFSSKNSMFTNLFIGRIIEDENDVEKSCNFIQTQIFKDFITRDIGLKNMLNMGTEIVDYTALQNQVFAQLQIISNKIASDRGSTSNTGTSNNGTSKQVNQNVTPIKQFIPYNPSQTFLKVPVIGQGILGAESKTSWWGGKKTIKKRNIKKKIAFSKNKKNKLKHKRTHKKRKYYNYKYKKTR